ncbi:cytochrome P450 [Echria macrotheca]|uniref:Cytochrome P450 n=1 Tax=Echria macrotheca TaxID=438768 RepID=A0AAJ0B422_9PEZI|nr:cytochrome P450 [Echria macrotheca]
MTLAQAVQEFITQNPLASILAFVGLVVSITFLQWGSDGPPSIPEKIPFVSNTYLVLTNLQEMARKAAKYFQGGKIVKYHLLNKTVYVVRGQQNMQQLLRGSPDLGSEGFILDVMKGLFAMTPSDHAKFVNDKSGRLKTPNPGTEATPVRYWAAIHYLYYDYLTAPHFASALATKFNVNFSAQLETQPLGEWTTVRIQKFVHTHLFHAAVVSLCGPRIFELNPDFTEVYWEFDPYAMMLCYVPPRWMARKAYQTRARGMAAVERWLDAAWERFDWDDKEAVEADWEPCFGARFNRETCRWMKDHGFDKQSITGFILGVIFGLNGNSIPMVTWSLMHLLQDPELLAAAREEAVQVYSTDGNGSRDIDIVKLGKMPILQAVFAETLRLHTEVTIAREVWNPVVVEGYKIPKGAFIHGYAGLAHYDEEVWGKDGHPADEFWAGRHLVEVEKDGKKRLEFSSADRAGNYFPFGGGTGMCPGRHFAKQEILQTMASILSRFDVKFVEWVNLKDGTKSDRGPLNDEYYGAPSMPPDRDAKVQWKRLW